ncbi:SPOR domain-containing protein [Flammeovirga pacifica]|uniref:SPOR domain-containing protein n=1 Tax=Flammeovirga pacifica TaxID=915059 RepID=A0A1S1YX65_FLAPC|nr:SPOR domain-containing protein [Flammeovirga pacifica]OHX65588.1 hypothetical protein NH26_04100 [Flammeovirga pacifica]
MKYTSKFLFLISIAFLFGACSPEQFSDEKPFSVKIASFREYDELENGISYLEQKGLEPYAISQINDINGKWYHLMIGAEKSLEDVLALKMKIEDSYGLNSLEVQNYNSLQQELLPVNENDVDNYPVSWSSLDLLLQLPYSENFKVNSLKSLSYFDDLNLRSNSISRNVEFDYPRGITQRNFNKNVEEIVEGNYQDPFSKTNITIHLIKLKEKNDFQEHISKEFADRILKSKRYNVQKQEAITVNNDWQMNGYAVTINPKELRSYLVLESASGLLLTLIQSDKNDINLLKAFARNIGGSHSVDEYNSVRRLLGALPDALEPTERMVAFDFCTKDSRRGKTALLEVNETELSCYIENSQKGTLVYQLENFNDQTTIDKVFRQRYVRYLDDPKVDKVLLGNRDAFFYKTRRRNPATRKLDWMLESVIFQNDDTIGKISNFKKGTFEQEEMLEKLASFKLGDEYQVNKL